MSKTAVLILRLDPDLMAKLDAFTAELSHAAQGAKISRSEAARVILRDRLANGSRRKPR